MKTKTTITELTKDDLVNLFCTAAEGSSWLDICKGETTGITEEEGDFWCDICAKAVLAGHKVKCYDYYAEGETYGNLGRVIKGSGDAVYFVGLDEIKKGLAKCADGTFNSDNDCEKAWLLECFLSFKDEDSGDFDITRADALMQVIMFGELVYG